MSGKKLIIVMAVLGVVSFAGTFVLSRWLGGSNSPSDSNKNAKELEEQNPETQALAKIEALTPKGQQLEQLIKEIRKKTLDVRRKSRELNEREKHIRIAREQLNKDAKDLESLRVQLAAPLLRLKEMMEELKRTRVNITKLETASLKRIAKVYEKMDTEKSGKQLMGMCANNQMDDAAKILHFMSTKGKAKVLAEITDTKLATQLVNKMKKVREEG